MEDTVQLLEKPHAEFREEKMRGVECPRHTVVQAVMESHRAMV